IPATLDAIMQQGSTRVVLVSGRRAAEVPKLLGTHSQPEVWGSHGWERLRPGGALTIEPASQIALEALIDASVSVDPAQRLGARIERTPASIALHWRGLPDERIAKIRSLVEPAWMALCDRAPVSLLEFDGGLELRALGHSKADAALSVLSECAADVPAAFLGD